MAPPPIAPPPIAPPPIAPSPIAPPPIAPSPIAPPTIAPHRSVTQPWPLTPPWPAAPRVPPAPFSPPTGWLAALLASAVLLTSMAPGKRQRRLAWPPRAPPSGRTPPSGRGPGAGDLAARPESRSPAAPAVAPRRSGVMMPDGVASTRALLVEDDPNIVDLIRSNLSV